MIVRNAARVTAAAAAAAASDEITVDLALKSEASL
jgi:hypothetical protein